MKLHLREFAFAMATALVVGGAAFAQNTSSQFVVSGPAAEKIQDSTTINLATAQRLADACEQAVTGHGAISVVVLDKDGNDVYIDRMDGVGNVQLLAAVAKTHTTAVTRQSSKVVLNRVTQDPSDEFVETQLGLVANSGALPIVVNKQFIGAIGGGGSAIRLPDWSDEICVQKALQQVIGSAAPLLPDLPPHPVADKGNAPVPRFAAPAMPPKSALSADFVVSGKAAGAILDGNQVSLTAAKKIASACRDWATSKGGAMSLYVIDNEGELVHMERMDGAQPSDTHAALLKAQTSIKTRQPTSIRDAQLKNDPTNSLRSIFIYDLYTVSGGMPIVVDGQMIGAMGVSGGAGGGDENCAVEGLKATFGDHVALPVYPTGKGGAEPQG